jgi:hypothetical protein
VLIVENSDKSEANSEHIDLSPEHRQQIAEIGRRENL